MQIKSFLLPIVAALLTSVSAADSSNKCSFSKTSITEATGISQLNACSTLDGEITVSGSGIGSIDLSSVKVLKAKLSILNSPSIVSLNFNQLQNITGALVINNATQLNSIDLTQLTNVETLQLVSLPSFAILNLNQGVQKAGTIVLSDTALTNLNGLASFNTIDSININNNKNISKIEFNDLQTVTDSLILSFNNDDAEVKLDSLKWAGNLTIQDVSSIQASNLTSVNGSLLISYNTFDELEFPNLKSVGNSMQIFAHDELTKISFPQLAELDGELEMFNNTQLEEIDFGNLTTIKGAVTISGPFDNLTMENLKLVSGDFQVNSTSDKFDCSAFDKLHEKGKIEGHNYVCTHPANPSSSSKSGSSTQTGKSDSKSSDGSSSSNSSSSSKKGAGNVLVVPGMVLTTALGVLLALI